MRARKESFIALQHRTDCFDRCFEFAPRHGGWRFSFADVSDSPIGPISNNSKLLAHCCLISFNDRPG